MADGFTGRGPTAIALGTLGGGVLSDFGKGMSPRPVRQAVARVCERIAKYGADL